MPTHKLANDFIKKWNKTLAIKGYSKMKVTEKVALIEKRLKEVKSQMVENMKKEWTGITSSYKTGREKNIEKRKAKKTAPKKKEPLPMPPKKKQFTLAKPRPIGTVAKPTKKSAVADIKITPKKKTNEPLWKEFKDILDKNESKLKNLKPPAKGKDVSNLFDYYNLLYRNRKKLPPEQYLKSLKEDIKKSAVAKKIPQNLKESIEEGVQLEREGLGLESSQFRKETCRHLLTISRGLIEAEKKGFPKIIDSNKEKFVYRGMGAPDSVSLKNPKLKKTSSGLTAESSLPTSQLEQIITFFQNHFYKYSNRFNKETPAKARADILRACGATEAQVYDKAVEILKKDYPTIIKKINSFKTKKRIELEALPENKLSEYQKELKTVIPNFLGTSTRKEKEDKPSKEIVPVSQKSAGEAKKETGPAVLRKMRTEMARNYRQTFGKNLYDVLGIPKNSNPTSEELKNICRKLQLKNHPDKGGSKEKIQEINEACRILEETIKKPKEKAPPKKPKKETGEPKEKSEFQKLQKLKTDLSLDGNYNIVIESFPNIGNENEPNVVDITKRGSKELKDALQFLTGTSMTRMTENTRAFNSIKDDLIEELVKNNSENEIKKYLDDDSDKEFMIPLQWDSRNSRFIFRTSKGKDIYLKISKALNTKYIKQFDKNNPQ
jgi:hypothetical protein